MVKFEDVPEALRLNYYMGEIAISDSFAEHEARVLWNHLFAVGLVSGKRPKMFGPLLKQLEEAFAKHELPDEYREIGAPLIAMTGEWHRYRSALVHDLLVIGWGRADDVHSAINKHPPRPLKELVGCGARLRNASYRLRGLYIVAPWWLGGKLDGWADADDLRSWTRAAMGHLSDEPNVIRGTDGPAPEPPGGWDNVVAAAVARREGEDARLAAFVIDIEEDDGDEGDPPGT